MPDSLLDREIYSLSDVDRLVGLRAGTARRWLEGYERGGRAYEPVLRPGPRGDEVVTWGEMVEARLLAEFRAREVPVQRLRPAVERLRAEFGRYPLARAQPLLEVEGRELVRRVQEHLSLDARFELVVVRNGQTMLSATADRFRQAVEYTQGIVSSITPHAQAPEVRLDPVRAFGQPAVRNVRTDVLAEDYRAGASRDELIDLYDLDAEQVDAALRFELISSSRVA